jgi:glycerol-3-phosphate dehydrogenase
MAEPPIRLADLPDSPFDMIVIGGGITGCGIARDAAMRGLRVVLLEQGDLASGTSSRSSRLIHGGLRYLEHGHLRLVFEASAERRRLLRLAPHLVRPLRFTWPVYRDARVSGWRLAAGLTLYDALALFRNVGRHHRLDSAEIQKEQPALSRDGLRGGATYYDARTDDSRLALAVAMDARDRGGAILNHTRVTAVIQRNGRTVGVEARDELTGITRRLSAQMTVNAAGPWSDVVRQLEGSKAAPRVQGSKGVHITVDRQRVGNNDALTLLSPDDGRVMFALPSGQQTIFGTTDTFTAISPDEVRASESDVDYLLAAANRFFPAARLGRGDVISAWAGIRPLAATGTGDSVSASREHAIAVTPTGVVTITGGKLTTFRIMAAQTVEAALRDVHRSAPPSRSGTVPLAWDPTVTLESAIVDATRVTGDEALGVHLVMRHGARWPTAWTAIRSQPGGMARIHDDLEYRMGELTYACHEEMAHTLADLLIRRTRIAFETRDHGRSVAPRVAAHVAPLLGWTPAAIQFELDRYVRDVDRIFRIDP